MADFSKLLSKPVESAEKPKPKPAGTYFGQIEGYTLGESKEKKTPYVRFTASNLSPGDDVDRSQLEGVDLTKWKPTFDFYLTEDSLYRLRAFLESLNLNVAGRTFNELMPETKNLPVKMTATNSTSQDGQNVYTNITEVTGAV